MRFVLAFFLCLSASASAPPRLQDAVPIRFEKQPAGSQARWATHGFGYACAFTDRAAFFRAGDRTVRLTFPGANAAAPFEATGPASTNTNYFIGTSYASVPGFARLRRQGIYPGIDVVYYGNGRQIEYDFEIAPGADPSRIRMRFDGADAVRLNERGGIALTLGSREVTQLAPVVYQRTARGEIVGVEARYQMDQRGVARLKLGKYNPTGALVVDPAIVYSDFLNGTTGADAAIAVAHDAQGRIYLAGYTYSTDFPMVGGSYQTTQGGGEDVWVVQVNMAAQGGPAVIYSSYIGGSANDNLTGMTVDSNGVIYLAGTSNSTNFPTTAGAYQSTITANTHVFVTMLDPSQSGTAGLVYSSYIGGSGTDDEGGGIAAAGGKIYVTGFTNSPDFPTVSAYQPAQTATSGGSNAFVAEFDPTQSGSSSLLVSTYLGGSVLDAGRTVAVDSAGKVYVAGYTFSHDFPVTTNAFQANYGTVGDAFLAELDFTAGTLLYSTFLGGSSIDEAKKIVIEPSGQVALTGYTLSPDFPVSQNAYQTRFGGNGNAFLTILDVTKSVQGLVYSSFYGGSGGEVAYDLALDNYGRYYLGGYTLSPDLPVTSDAMNSTSGRGGTDGFVAVIDPAAGIKGLVYGSYVTSDGIQMVNGVDAIPGSTGSPVEMAVAGMTTGNIFGSNGLQNGNTGKFDGFLLVLQIPAPAATPAQVSGDLFGPGSPARYPRR